MSLTDEQIFELAKTAQSGFTPHDDTIAFARAIESATAAPLLERIKELEQQLERVNTPG